MSWTDGRWSEARRVDAHPDRIGCAITPWAVVIHTTDMAPETFQPLLTAWRTTPGRGDCAHFVIGRDETDGVVQLCPITSNANHAGGPTHGVFVDAAGLNYHPNLVAVGIELHCAGGVQKLNGEWRLLEDGKPTGATIADLDVLPDPARPGRGWHRVTQYQYDQLGELLDELEYDGLATAPKGVVARSPFQTPSVWAVGNGHTVGHCSLDFKSRSDPWPFVMAWLRDRP